ncbi:MAG: MYXO-CTERM sorting domain-containing protein [Polyangiales bacterium]|nr:hypothetical protein [Myxococcales bacterium]MCB9658435.1 hypothetical protein [Sandaracinaceae bacterium]
MTCRVFGYVAAMLAGVASMVAPSGGFAQSLSVLDVSSSDNGIMLSCSDTFQCSTAGSGCDSSGACVAVNASLNVCVPGDDDANVRLFCCHTLDDCPRRAGQEAVSCQALVGDIKICRYGAIDGVPVGLCAGLFSSALEAVTACFAPPIDANGTRYSLSRGDCDGDGEINREDSEPCTSSIIPVFDAGVVDVGVVRDATVVPPLDQDVDVDGGHSSSGPTTAFQGGGGCSVGAAANEAALPAWALLGLVVVARMRRRRS